MAKFVNTEALTEFWAKVKTLVSGKQDTLVSGTNIKTVNNTSLLGAGNISISGAFSGMLIDTVEISTGTVSHGGNSAALTATAPAHAGYTPFAIAGWDTTGSSQRQNWFVFWRCLLDGDTVTLRVCNHHPSDSAYTTYRVYVAYAPE